MENPDLLAQIRSRPDRIPRHVGVILDGNRRWAREKGLPVREGYLEGAKTCEKMFYWALDAGIQVLSIWVWSTENFNRDKDQVSFLMKLFARYIKKAIKDRTFPEKKIRVKFIGRVDLMPASVRDLGQELEHETEDNSSFLINVCMAYGGRDEIVQAVRSLALQIQSGQLQPADIDEKVLTAHLGYQGPDPDLVIRTSGELRTSGFLLWQTAYSEWYFESKYMPALEREDFYQAILDYQSRDRRFGK